MGILDQIGEVAKALTNPAEALENAKDQVADSLKNQATELGNDVFKGALDTLGITSILNWLSTTFGAQGVFSFLGLGQKPEPQKEVNDTRVWNVSGEFQSIFKSTLVGNAVKRLINNQAIQGMSVACYNIAENYRWKKYGQNLFTTEADIENKEEKPEMNAVSYIKNNTTNLNEGDVIWVQGNINTQDTASSDPSSMNHWFTVVRKDADGTIYVGDQNGTYPVDGSVFWKERYFRKLYKAPQKGYVPDERTA